MGKKNRSSPQSGSVERTTSNITSSPTRRTNHPTQTLPPAANIDHESSNDIDEPPPLKPPSLLYWSLPRLEPSLDASIKKFNDIKKMVEALDFCHPETDGERHDHHWIDERLRSLITVQKRQDVVNLISNAEPITKDNDSQSGAYLYEKIDPAGYKCGMTN